jgi:hypothetical protein
MSESSVASAGGITITERGLAAVGGELGQKLVVGDASRSVEAGHLLDLGTDRQRDVPGQRNALQIFGYVEVGLNPTTAAR